MAQADIILEQIQAILYPELIIMFGLSIMMFSAGWYLNAYLHLKDSKIDDPIPTRPLQQLPFSKEIIDKSSDIIFIKDTQLRIIFANSAYARIFNKEPEDLYGKTDSENGWDEEFIKGNPQKGISGFEKDDIAALSGEVIQNFSTLSKYNGRSRYFDTRKMPLRDDSGEIIAILGMTRDITERKRLEDIQTYNADFQELVTVLATEFINLRSYNFDAGVNHLLQQIGEFIGAGRTYIYHFTDETKIASMVYEWTSSDTKPQKDIQQNLSTDLFKITFDKFKRGEEEFIANALDLPPSRQVEKDRLLEQGIYARITLPLFQDDTLIGSMGFHATQEGVTNWATYTVDLLKIVAEIYVNLLNSKQVGDKIRYQASLLENVTDAIISTDMDMKVISWNRGAEKLYGYSEAEVIGKNFSTILHTDYLGLSRDDIIQDFLANDQWKGELIRYHKDGTAIDVLVSVSIIKDYSGKRIGAISVNHDISERKHLEKQQTRMTIQTERIQLLEEVISDLSHDIKTPLASILVNLYLLQKKPESENRGKYIKRMEVQVKHLNKLVDDILTMSRIDKGADLKFAPLNLNTLIQQISNTYYDLLEIRGNTINFDLSANIKPVLGSEAELNRVFANLLENAIYYSASGESILIRSYSQGEFNIFEIQDSGIGISEADLPHIFNRFYRADKARDTSKGGTGLGLAIVKKLVDLHGGIITVQSQIGIGSTFRVKLPVSS